jgi:hypothetical protein
LGENLAGRIQRIQWRIGSQAWKVRACTTSTKVSS